MEISNAVQLEYGATAPAGELLRLPECKRTIREPGTGERRFRLDISRKTFNRDVTKVKETLIPGGRAAISGIALGISSFVIYLLLQCLLPAQGSGMAILGERFNGAW